MIRERQNSPLQLRGEEVPGLPGGGPGDKITASQGCRGHLMYGKQDGVS